MRQIQEDLAGKLGVLALLDLLRGMVADIAIHAAHRKGDHRNGHAHVMLTIRERTAKGFGAKVRPEQPGVAGALARAMGASPEPGA